SIRTCPRRISLEKWIPSGRNSRKRRRPPAGRNREDLRELIGRRDLELVVAAIARRLVRPPAKEHRRVAEAVPLQVVVFHLAHALDPQRLPGEVLPGAPTAARARYAPGGACLG